MARDQKPFSRGNVTISIFVADFSISVPRHDRQISWTGSSIFFSSLFLFSLFSPPALLPGSVTSPRRRIYRLDSPSIYIYIRNCHVPYFILATTVRIGPLLSFRARSSQIVTIPRPTDRPNGYANAWNAGDFRRWLRVFAIVSSTRVCEIARSPSRANELPTTIATPLFLLKFFRLLLQDRGTIVDEMWKIRFQNLRFVEKRDEKVLSRFLKSSSEPPYRFFCASGCGIHKRSLLLWTISVFIRRIYLQRRRCLNGRQLRGRNGGS